MRLQVESWNGIESLRLEENSRRVELLFYSQIVMSIHGGCVARVKQVSHFPAYTYLGSDNQSTCSNIFIYNIRSNQSSSQPCWPRPQTSDLIHFIVRCCCGIWLSSPREDYRLGQVRLGLRFLKPNEAPKSWRCCMESQS